MASQDSKDIHQFTMRIEGDQAQLLEVLARHKETTFTGLVRTALDEYLAHHADEAYEAIQHEMEVLTRGYELFFGTAPAISHEG